MDGPCSPVTLTPRACLPAQAGGFWSQAQSPVWEAGGWSVPGPGEGPERGILGLAVLQVALHGPMQSLALSSCSGA